MLSSINKFFFAGLCTLGLFFSACYSFQGTSIPPEVKTFYVDLFENNALDVVPALDVTFTEALKTKIRNESRLRYNDTDPDIEFSGQIIQYDEQDVAPEPGETTAFSRLRMVVAVEYVNNKIETDKWKENFSFQVDFPNDQNLIDIQDDLISSLNDQITENIFNKAFNNW